MPTQIMLRRILLLGLLVSPSAWARDNGFGWLEVRSPHFTVITDAGEARGRHVAGQFERMRWVFQGSLPAASLDPANPIVVLAVKDRKDMEALEPVSYLAKGQVTLGGLFSRSTDKNYILVRLDVEGQHPYSFVYHEYTHLLEGREAEWMPLWLNEGLAQFFENTDVRDKEVLLGEPSINAMVLLQQNRMIPLPVLFKVDASSPYYHQEQKGDLFYAESWALTQYLWVQDHQDHENRLGRYSVLMSKGTDPVSAAQQAFGDLNQLQTALENYVRLGRYPIFQKSTEGEPLNEASFAVTPLSVANADAVRADFLVSTGRLDDARALAGAALTADASSARAHEAMGRIEVAADHHPEAKKWYAEAAALDPDSYVAQYYSGALAVMAGESSDDAENHLRTAIRLNPRFAPAYDALAALLADERGKLEQAHMMELQAIQLDPGNLHYRLSTAHILIRQQQFDRAVLVLAAAKTLARNPLEVNVVERMLKQVEEQRAQMEKDRQQEAADEQARAIATAQMNAAARPEAPPLPQHLTESPHGPDHYAVGVIRGVRCGGPEMIQFRVEGARGAVNLFSNDAYNIDYRALNFTPTAAIDPCHDLEGMRARVHYFTTSDKTIDGQITIIALWK